MPDRPQAPIPAACTRCGAVFPLKTVFFGAGLNIKRLAIDNVQDSCPHCGGLAYAAEGVFRLASDVLTVISAPDVTKEMLASFAEALKSAQATSTDAEALAREVEKINPSFADLVRQNAGLKSMYAALFAITLTAINSCSVEVKLDANRLIEQLMNSPAAAEAPAADRKQK